MSSYQPTTAASAATSMGGYGNTRRGMRNTAAPSAAAAAAAPTTVTPTTMSNTALTTGSSGGGGSSVSDFLHKGAATAAVTNTTTTAIAATPGSTAANHNALASPRTADGKSTSSADSVIEELKALAKSMLEATNAARRRTSSIEHRNSYEALMHAIENRVNGDGAAGRNSGGKGTIGGVGAAATGSARLQRYVDPTSADMSESELLSTHLMEQLTDIPSELSPESRVRQLQQLEQLQQQQQQQRSKATKGRNATAVTAAAEASVTAAAVTGGVTTKAAAPRVPADSAREDIAEEEVDDDGEEEEDGEGEPSITTAKVAVAHRPTQSLAPEEEDDDDDGTAYDGVRAQVLFKPVNRTAYHEVLASTWKPEGLTLRVPLETNTAKKEPANSSSSGSSNSGSGSDGEKEDVEEEAVQHRHGDNDDDDDAMASVVTRNKALKASEAQSMRAMKVYRVPAFPYGGGVTEQQARLLQRQFDACIQSGEHLHSNAAGPKLITKADFDSYQYSEVDVKTAQLDVASFQPTSPYEFVVEVEREVRFDAVKAREERRRRFKRLVHENRAPATMGTFDLRVIMDPFKTGFEEEKNFPIIAGTVIAGRYEIIQMLGKATFSRAVRCYDLHDPIYVDIEEEDDGEDGADDDADDVDGDNADENGASASPAENTATDKEVSGHGNSQHGEVAEAAGAASDAKKGSKKKSAKKRKLVGYGQVCLKIINNTKDFFDQALDEIRLLTLLNRQRDPDEAHIVRLIDAFYYKEHVMLVTELLRDTLYDYGKYNREEEEEFYFTVPRLRRLTRQIVEALTYVHSLNLIHTDLKPENIMFVSYSRCIVKVIDFGSSCFLSDHLSSYIQSRSYRAPEVVLGCDYDGRIDVWSLGAILVEMVTGDVLFTSDTVPEMLARIVYVCGTPFPRHMLWEGRHTSDYINKFGCIYEYGGAADDQRGANTSRGDDDGEEPYCLYTPVPTMAPHTCNAPKKAKPASTTSRTPAGPYSVLREKLAAANMVDKDFISFVEACLTLDHKKRPTTAQLLDHPFIKNEPL